MLSELFINLLLALVFGATVGLERESNNPNDPHVGGIRTFALISLYGALTGIIIIHQYISVAWVLIGGFLVLLTAYYVAESVHTKDFGITSELSAIITFVLGLIVMLNIIPLQVTVAIFVVVIFVLSLKAKTTKLVAGVSKQEIQSFISYAIIALVALPVLPDYSYQLKDIPLLHDLLAGFNVDISAFDNLDLINPRKIWLVVVLITGIDVFGYVLGRILGQQNGFAISSFMAGFISSTSATQSLAQRSTQVKQVNYLVGAAVLANLASFLQIILLVVPLNTKWLIAILPSILLMIISAGIITWIFYNNHKPKQTSDDDNQTKKTTAIFSLFPALKFAGLLMVIKIFTKICLIVFGQSGFVISSIIASFAGLDAIIVNLAEMAGNTITFKFALLTFLLVNATNLLSKSVYSYLQGTRSFAFKFLAAAVIIALSGALWLLFI